MTGELLLTKVVPDFYKEVYEPGDVCWTSGEIFLGMGTMTETIGEERGDEGEIIRRGVRMEMPCVQMLRVGQVDVSPEQAELAVRYGWIKLGETPEGLVKIGKW